MMENCNYDRAEMMAFNIVRQGAIGEVLHAEGGYLHDLGERFTLGDVNTSLIKTALGKTVMVQHCTNLPRPYSRINLVQGTKGMFQGYPDRVYIEGRGKPHQWVTAADVRDEFDHPLGKEIEARAAGAGHGGMDFIEDYRLVKCLREGLPTDLDVPDFTRGRWRTNQALDLVGV